MMFLSSSLAGGVLWIGYIQWLNHERPKHGPGWPIFFFLLLVYIEVEIMAILVLIEILHLPPSLARSLTGPFSAITTGRIARHLLHYYLTP